MAKFRYLNFILQSCYAQQVKDIKSYVFDVFETAWLLVMFVTHLIQLDELVTL